MTESTSEPAGLPTFAKTTGPPRGLINDPLPEGATTEPAPEPGTETSGEPAGPGIGDVIERGIPTGSYSVGTEPRTVGGDPRTIARMAATLIGMAAMAAAWIVRRRGAGTELREPTRAEREAIAEPLARVAVRHLDLTALGPDMVDLVEAGNATGAYLTAGPLIRPPAVDLGEMPNDDEGNEP